jgi:hypothetical protein
MLVPDNKGRVEGGEDPYLIEGIFLLFIGEVIHLDLFEGVDLRIGDALHFVDAGVCSLTQFGDNYKVL